MAGENDPRAPEIQLRVNSRRGNTVHPVEVESPRQVGMREVKHFKKWVPWLIPVFVVVNVVMFVVTMYVNDCPSNSDDSCIARFLGRFSFQPFKENPLLGPSSTTLLKMGGLYVNKVVHGNEGWRLLSCNWLHGGVFHILANMLSLLVIGIRLEQEFGFVRIGLLYVISGFGGSLMSALFLQTNISVGASGALFGLLGGMLSELITNWTIYVSKFAALFTLVVIIAVNLAVGILPHVDNFAHIGGFLTGFLLGFVFLIRPQFGWVSQRYATPYTTPNATPGYQSPGFGASGSTTPLYPSAPTKSKFKTYQCVLWAVSLVLVIVGLTLGLVMILRGVDANDHCSWCHYLSCVPTSRWSCKTEPASCMLNQLGDQLSLTCSSNNRTRTYTESNPSNSRIQGLCTQLCS